MGTIGAGGFSGTWAQFPPDIPAVTGWGLAVTALLLLAAGGVVVRRRARVKASG